MWDTSLMLAQDSCQGWCWYFDCQTKSIWILDMSIVVVSLPISLSKKGLFLDLLSGHVSENSNTRYTRTLFVDYLVPLATVSQCNDSFSETERPCLILGAVSLGKIPPILEDVCVKYQHTVLGNSPRVFQLKGHGMRPNGCAHHHRLAILQSWLYSSASTFLLQRRIAVKWRIPVSCTFFSLLLDHCNMIHS